MLFSTFVALAAQAAIVLGSPLAASSSSDHGTNAEAGPRSTPKKITGAFEKPITLSGGMTLQAVSFPSNKLGSFGVQYQDTYARDLTVAVEKQPDAAAPAGYKFLDTSSYLLSMIVSVPNAPFTTKFTAVSYAWNAAALKAGDYSTARLGRVEGRAFVLNDGGKFTWEDGVSKVTLDHIPGEWAIFGPVGGKTDGTTGGGK